MNCCSLKFFSIIFRSIQQPSRNEENGNSFLEEEAPSNDVPSPTSMTDTSADTPDFDNKFALSYSHREQATQKGNVNRNSASNIISEISPTPSSVHQSTVSARSREFFAIENISSSNDISNPPDYGEFVEELKEKGATAVVSVYRKREGSDTIQLYAVKTFLEADDNIDESQIPKRLKREFNISLMCRHRNIIETIDLVRDNQGQYCLISKYCDGGDLYSVLANNKETMTHWDRCCLFKQMMRGIAYLHSLGIAHRDLKLENMVLTSDGTLKIIDFGAANIFRSHSDGTLLKSSGLAGSEPYIAPEVLGKSHYWGFLADIWSAGIVMYTLWECQHPWSKATEKNEEYQRYLRYRESRIRYPNFEQHPASMRHLFYAMLDPRPNARISAEQVLEDKWVQSILVCNNGTDALNRDHHHTRASG